MYIPKSFRDISIYQGGALPCISMVAAGVQYVTQHLGQSLQLLKLKKNIRVKSKTKPANYYKC